ncbi:sulfotransferase family protein [Synechococcus sp. BDU 130192]|uniref:sulfotransferase family protein n=1 Tax=Synechococcus sp. BDU 130192 TaxID=2042059 RepID=UPI000C07D87D|nr:sulfotransferase [Synechococcus sp. BDU 130192]
MNLKNIRQVIKCNIKRYIKVFENLYFLINQEKYASFLSDQEPVFIVGCGHSGTSIMLAILGSHSQLYSVPYESRVFHTLSEGLASKLDVYRLSSKWKEACLKSGKNKWIEKTPVHLFQLERIFDFFPKAKVIIMVRDGRDVVCSLRNRGRDFQESISLWTKSIDELKKYVHDPRVMTINLEDLIKDPKGILSEACIFIGYEYEDQILSYHEQPKYYYSNNIGKPLGAKEGKEHLELRNWQINQPLFEETTRWKSEMILKEKEIFKRLAQKYLEDLDYVSNDQW